MSWFAEAYASLSASIATFLLAGISKIIAASTFSSAIAHASQFAGTNIFVFSSANILPFTYTSLFINIDASLFASASIFLSASEAVSLSIGNASIPLFLSSSFHVLRSAFVIPKLLFFLDYFLFSSPIIIMTI